MRAENRNVALLCATQDRLSRTPVNSIVRTPKRLINVPVKKDGANIAMTCHWITKAASLNGWAQDFIASGVAAISRFITP